MAPLYTETVQDARGPANIFLRTHTPVTERVDGPRDVQEFIKAGLVLLVLSIWALSIWSPARAAGGAHIVDDSEVETPGTCHVEMWVTRFIPGDGYANAAPACTSKRIPFLEVGFAYQDYWSEQDHAPILGPTIKVNLRPQETGLGLAIEGTTGVNILTGNLNFASVLGVMTIPIDEKFRVNLNAGWNYVQSDNPDALFYGAQIEATIARDLTLMVEGFGRAPGFGGVQAGLRYTPKDGPLDFDLLAARFIGPDQPFFFTIGVTVRF